MIQKIPCFCDNSFTVEVPEEIDLDLHPERIDEILNGTFLNFTCSSCGKKHKPEFAIKILWPSKKIWFDVIGELDRGEFYRSKKEKENGPLKKVTVIGYPELADRILVYRDALDPAAVECIKYYLYLKAEENYPDEQISIWYSGRIPQDMAQPLQSLEFHIHGLKKDEIAVMKVPFSLYSKTLEDNKKHPKNEILTALKHNSYLSVNNMLRPEALK